MIQDDINKAAWSVCDVFRGVVDQGIYRDYVLTMFFIKYISDVWRDNVDRYQVEYGDHPEMIVEMLKNERFVLPPGAGFDDLYQKRHQPGNGERIDKSLHAIEEANFGKLHDVFQNISFNATELGGEARKNAILRRLLEHFAKPELDLRPSHLGRHDMIGTAFEYLIKNFSADAGKKGDHYYTPAEISELIVELVSPRAGDEICDPTCGSGSLLLKCGQQVHKYFNSKKYALYGQEAIGSTWALARMNLFLHGEDNHRIEWGDTISNPRLLDGGGRLRRFDVVVANPPFSLENWGYDSAIGDKYGRFRRGLPPKGRGDYAFILHMIETLKPGTGRMGVVVPNGVLFRGSGERVLRQKLVDENLLDAVIGLPEKLFYGTGISAAILLFRKQKRNKTVLFIDASRQFLEGKSHNILREEDIARVVAAYEAGKSDGKYVHLATYDEIRGNDYNLNIPRYIDPFEDNEIIDLEAIRKERKQLKLKLEQLEPEMAAYLEELGYGPHR